MSNKTVHGVVVEAMKEAISTFEIVVRECTSSSRSPDMFFFIERDERLIYHSEVTLALTCP